MPDLWVDVDTALSSVPVNIAPLIDDTDFKTREEAVTYDQAGMDLVWNFTTTAGVTTQTAVTPTTGGNYDWTNLGNGMYAIEIPASGGVSINNDTEGVGWFSGFATGILPWRGPTIGFRAAGINNLLIDSAYSATRGLAGTALPNAAADAAGGLPISDAGGLDMDAIKSDSAAIKVKTDFLPSATAGAAGGVFIAGTNAATSITTALTANITGNLSGSVGSVTGAVGSVTGAVGSVAGNVDGNVTGSIGSLATQAKADVNAECDTALSDASLPTAAQVMSQSLGVESYAADGSVPTLAQALFALISMVGEFSISGTTITCKKLDGSTTAMTFTLDDGTSPTSRTRSS